MNKMAKGALATGVGVALLLGGGGTLAVWNQTANASAGTIAAGDLKLTAETGVWKNAAGVIVDLDPTNNIPDYKVVPGDVLTYTQVLNVKLDGDQMQATLKLDGQHKSSSFANGDITVNGPKFLGPKGAELPSTITPAHTGKVTATASFTFNANGQSSTNASADLAGIGYKLEQIAPGK